MKCEVCSRDNLNEKELEMHIKVFHKKKSQAQQGSQGFCPDCGNTLIFEEGCQRCSSPSCGFSHCG